MFGCKIFMGGCHIIYPTVGSFGPLNFDFTCS